MSHPHSDSQTGSDATFSRRAVLAAGGAVGVGALTGVNAFAARPGEATDVGIQGGDAPWDNGRLVVSEGGRFLQHENGEPFFWMGDTAFLLHKLSPREIRTYFNDRREKGFNVVKLQVVPGSLTRENYYGEVAFIDGKVGDPNPRYWRHVDLMVREAEKRGIYMGMIAVWSDVPENGDMDVDAAIWYGQWLAERYRDHPNIVWLNGGDGQGHDIPEVWSALGNSIKETDGDHLMTFHPDGRYSSSTWYHNEPWLDFNAIQSGHRTYEQSDNGVHTGVTGVNLPSYFKGEDNWKVVIEDYMRYPPKPTLDIEPSYEGIPHGLDGPGNPLWKAQDARRYAYWGVFAGACGHSYGHGALMYMHIPSDPEDVFGVGIYWDEALDAPAGGQMQYLKRLMLSRPYFDRIYDPTVVDGDPGYRYDHVIATRGEEFLFAYTYTGRAFSIRMGKISGDHVDAWWYDPRTGEAQSIGRLANEGVREFDPPGEVAEGNDWVLVLDDVSQEFGEPGN